MITYESVQVNRRERRAVAARRYAAAEWYAVDHDVREARLKRSTLICSRTTRHTTSRDTMNAVTRYMFAR